MSPHGSKCVSNCSNIYYIQYFMVSFDFCRWKVNVWRVTCNESTSLNSSRHLSRHLRISKHRSKFYSLLVQGQAATISHIVAQIFWAQPSVAIRNAMATSRSIPRVIPVASVQPATNEQTPTNINKHHQNWMRGVWFFIFELSSLSKTCAMILSTCNNIESIIWTASMQSTWRILKLKDVF